MRSFAGAAQSFDPIRGGYRVMYHPGETNRCPGCGQSSWHVGRVTAQCAFCGTALALALSARNFLGVDDRLSLAS